MSSNNTVTKSLKILELIARNPQGITLGEIYRELDIPKTTCHSILKSLYDEDAVYYKDLEKKTYTIGSKMYSIGQSYIEHSNFLSYAKPLLTQFADKYDATCYCVKRLGTKTVFTYMVRSDKARLSPYDSSRQESLELTAPGISFLSFLNKDKSDELLDRIKNTNFKLNNDEFKDLLNQINKYKDLGYVISNSEKNEFELDLAIPVYNFENQMIGSIYASRFPLKDKELGNFINDFKEISKTISIRQGYKVK